MDSLRTIHRNNRATHSNMVQSVFTTSTLQLAPRGVIFQQLKWEFLEKYEDDDIAVHVMWAAPFNHRGQKEKKTIQDSLQNLLNYAVLTWGFLRQVAYSIKQYLKHLTCVTFIIPWYKHFLTSECNWCTCSRKRPPTYPVVSGQYLVKLLYHL